MRSHTKLGYDLLRALESASCDIAHETGVMICYGHLGSASCDNTHETGGTICYGHWVLRLVISHARQRVRFVSGIGFCVLWYHTRDRGYDLLRALRSASCNITHVAGGTVSYGYWVLRLVISHTRQGVRFVTGIGICVL